MQIIYTKKHLPSNHLRSPRILLNVFVKPIAELIAAPLTAACDSQNQCVNVTSSSMFSGPIVSIVLSS